ncbi:MAG: type II toxin-antitoxin system HicA family toxin [Rhodospirillales bacterium]
MELLRAAGCTFVRHGKGSHEIWFSPVTQRNIVVPINTVQRHTANAVLKQAGIAKKL